MQHRLCNKHLIHPLPFVTRLESLTPEAPSNHVKAGTSEALILLPWTTGTSEHRNAYRPQRNWVGYGRQYYMISPFAHTPETIIPVGQTPFISKVTKREKWFRLVSESLEHEEARFVLPALL